MRSASAALLCLFTALLVFAATNGCTPTMRAHYLSAPMRDIAHAHTATLCGVTLEHALEVLAVPPADCPDLDSVDFAAGRVLKLIPNADQFAIAGARVTYTAHMIDCSDPQTHFGAHFAIGCTLGDEMVVQDHSGLGWGFALKTTEHEIAHAARYRLGLPDAIGPSGEHEPATWWGRIDGIGLEDAEVELRWAW